MPLPSFRLRSVTAIVFAVLMIGSLVIDPKLFSLVLIAFSIQGYREYSLLIEKSGYKLNRYAGAIIGTALFTIQLLINIELLEPRWNVLLLAIAFIFLTIELLRNPAKPIEHASLALLAVVWIFLPMSLFASMATIGYGELTGTVFVLGFLAILWVNDSAAYIVGSLIGKTPIYYKVSPGKTWEGALAGIIFGIFAAWLFSALSNSAFMFWLPLALIIIITGTLGDLAESLLKRNFKAKDSGSLLPGHGGVLDRFDSILFSAPFVWIYLQIAT
ncbi:MAG TPA: phosphatidate cytidylyltransferase [Bacteroidales bacterium]|nr:phosphatidate cytidylyltransferase [Bacteroidales bacterium]